MKEKGKRPFPLEVKQQVRHNQGCLCALCGKYDTNLSIHHILPASMGGQPVLENAVGLCRGRKKGERGCHEFLDEMALVHHKALDMQQDTWYEL